VPETVGKASKQLWYKQHQRRQQSSGAGAPPTEGTTEMVRTQTTVGTPVTAGTQAELGSVDRRRTARTGCYENYILMKKKHKNSKT
jgi:hypothetical protein